jgi:putative glycosyltransferase (TIGR04372 family)
MRVSSSILRLTVRWGFRFYGLLRRNRKIALPLLLFASRIADRQTQSGGPGERAVVIVHRQILRDQISSARISLILIAAALTVATQIHLAASKKRSAIRTVRILNLLFRNRVRARRGLIANVYFSALSFSGSYSRIVREIPYTEAIDGFSLNFAIGVAHLYRGRDNAAIFFLQRAAQLQDSHAERKLGCGYLLKDDYASAAKCFHRSVQLEASSVMVHQNYAGQYDPSRYTPSNWELENAGELLVYDNLIQLGENFYHQGQYTEAFRCYRKAFDYQDVLSGRWAVPDALLQKVASACPHFDRNLPVRLLGYEWVTMIGHIGLLDCYLRMASLGMLPKANYVLLAPPSKVANQAFLQLWQNHVSIVTDPILVDDLLPYQRLIGDQFIGFRSDHGMAEPWSHAASRAQVAWAKLGRKPLVVVSDELREFGKSQLRRMGVPDSAWFVALHVREGGFHGDGAGSIRQHRSANVDDYLAAIEHIIKRGGCVIRLGDASMTPIAAIRGVFDYAHSNFKSQRMDVFLAAACRLFIGTTSGLTSAVQALGAPMLLVNCTSSDCQFWHAQTDFIVKPVFDRHRKRYLSLGETYRQPLQAQLIDTEVLDRRGYEIRDNSSEEILASVRYALNCLDGIEQRLSENDELLKRYRASLAENPLNFGAALPVRPFLESHREFLDENPSETGLRQSP